MRMMETINNGNTLTSSMTSPSALFSVKFFDGERELDMGTVQITPSLTFKSFQSILSQNLQRSPHQITIYFERQNNNNHNYFHHHRRRYPVTSKFDFGSVIPESDSAFFWVVQKRSRRTRRRKPKVNNNIFNINNNSNNSNFMLLRRDCNELEYLRMMQIKSQQQCERYLMTVNLNSDVYDDLSRSFYGNSGFGGYNCHFGDDGASSSGGGSSIDYGGGRVMGGFCDVCYQNAVKGEAATTPFHWCKNDAVTQVYRSPAGPIAPPKKK